MPTVRAVKSLLFVTILFSALSLSGVTPAHIVLMHTNDIHGHILPENGAGGLAIIATIVKQQHPDILLDAGDMFTGTLVSDSFRGESVMAVMNRMGYRASVLGNHEFDFGLQPIRDRIKQAKFPILSANVTLPFSVDKTRVVRVKGIRIGIIGLSTEETPTTTHPKNVKGVQFADVVSTVRQVLPSLQKSSDFIVVLGHLAPVEELGIARAFPEIRLIVSGHTHTELREPIRERDTLIVRTGNFGRFVGQVDLDFEDRSLKLMSSKLIEARGVEPDPGALKAVEPFRLAVERQMNAVLGEATANLPRTPDESGTLMNLVTDAFRARTGTQIALANPGGIRTSLPAGPITYGKVFEIFPFENTVVTMKITGAQLKRSLGVGVTAVSGVRAVFDLSKPQGQALTSVTLADGSPIIDNATYSVAINDFMQAGGDGYAEFANGTEIQDTGIRVRDMLRDYIKEKKTITPVVDGRIQVLK